MKYKIYEYWLRDSKGYDIAPDRHFEFFQRSTGRDEYGQFAEYRGQKNSVLMHLRRFSKDFSGLVGRHSQEREVTEYVERTDETLVVVVEDDDYPNTPFICFPRLKAIAVLDGSRITADAAVARLHQILGHRTHTYLTYGTFREALDLRRAVARFKVTEVTFEVLPVNPHTGPLGKRLDEARAKDHIRKITGRLEGKKTEPLKLEGGFLTEVQQLQQSGHAKVGYKGYADNDMAIEVAKPKEARELEDEPAPGSREQEVDIRVEVAGRRIEYPFPPGTFTQLRTIVRRLTARDDDD